MDPRHLRPYVIEPTLHHIELHSEAAVELVLGTALVESGGLRYLKQLDNGPAVGIYQMEPFTHDDIWTHFLNGRKKLAFQVSGLMSVDAGMATADQMIGNLWYATAMARVHYRRRPQALPQAGDIRGQAEYWKQHYNTHQGKGTVEKYLASWEKHMGKSA